MTECSFLGVGVPLKFGHDALEVGKIRRTFPGSLFKRCELTFGGSLVVRVVVGVVQDVPEFLGGVKIDSVADDVRVDHSVGIALEE